MHQCDTEHRHAQMPAVIQEREKFWIQPAQGSDAQDNGQQQYSQVWMWTGSAGFQKSHRD